MQLTDANGKVEPAPAILLRLNATAFPNPCRDATLVRRVHYIAKQANSISFDG